MPKSAELFQEWRTADRQAHALGQSVVKRAMRALDGLCECPTPEEHDAAHKLRATANDLFQLAMAEMAERTKGKRN